MSNLSYSCIYMIENIRDRSRIYPKEDLRDLGLAIKEELKMILESVKRKRLIENAKNIA